MIYSLESKEIVKNAILNLIAKNKNAIFSANSINNQLKWSSPNFNKEVIKELESKGIIKKSAPNLYMSTHSNIDDIFSYAKEEILKKLQDGGITPIAPYNIYDSHWPHPHCVAPQQTPPDCAYMFWRFYQFREASLPRTSTFYVAQAHVITPH